MQPVAAIAKARPFFFPNGDRRLFGLTLRTTLLLMAIAAPLGAPAMPPAPSGDPAEGEIRIEAAGQAAAQAAAPGQITTLELGSLEYGLAGAQVFRFSTFFNPRTSNGARAYWEVEDHYAARLFGPFEWNAHQSTGVKDFRKKLERHRGQAEFLGETHEKLIIPIVLMPEWLSTSKDRRPIEGFFRRCNAHGPKSYRKWNDLVRELVRFYRRLEDTEIYYEIWNEPDLEYWQEGTDEYLRLYEETARTIKATDPRAKVGGAALNGWDGKAAGSSDRDILNLELIRFARRRNVPLDFVSWHHFSARTESLRAAVHAYEKALREAGYTRKPEFVISEWNVGRRAHDTPYQAAMMAELMVTFYEVGIDVQTVAAWENWHPDPCPDRYGLITQGGRIKPTFHLHAAFAALARESRGIVAIREPSAARLEGDRRIVVSRKADDRYSIMLWENGYSPPDAAALRTLLDSGVSREDLNGYGSREILIEAVRSGRPRDGRQREAFLSARRVYESFPVRRRPVLLRVPGTRELEVLSAAGIGGTVREVPVESDGDRLAIELDKYEVLSMEVRVK